MTDLGLLERQGDMPLPLLFLLKFGWGEDQS